MQARVFIGSAFAGAALFLLALRACVPIRRDHRPLGPDAAAAIALLLTFAALAACVLFVQSHVRDTSFFCRVLERGIDEHQNKLRGTLTASRASQLGQLSGTI